MSDVTVYQQERVPKWFALQVHTSYERATALRLAQRGHQVFLPLYSVKRRWSDRWKIVQRPLFDGYVFCHCDLPRDGMVRNVPGVIRVTGNGEMPVPIPDEEIAAIERSVKSGLPVSPWKDFEDGREVEVAEGPLSGLRGRVVSTVRGWQLIISVTLFRRAIAVTVDPSWITPVPKPLLVSQSR